MNPIALIAFHAVFGGLGPVTLSLLPGFLTFALVAAGKRILRDILGFFVRFLRLRGITALGSPVLQIRIQRLVPLPGRLVVRIDRNVFAVGIPVVPRLLRRIRGRITLLIAAGH